MDPHQPPRQPPRQPPSQPIEQPPRQPPRQPPPLRLPLPPPPLPPPLQPPQPPPQPQPPQLLLDSLGLSAASVALDAASVAFRGARDVLQLDKVRLSGRVHLRSNHCDSRLRLRVRAVATEVVAARSARHRPARPRGIHERRSFTVASTALATTSPSHSSTTIPFELDVPGHLCPPSCRLDEASISYSLELVIERCDPHDPIALGPPQIPPSLPRNVAVALPEDSHCCSTASSSSSSTTSSSSSSINNHIDRSTNTRNTRNATTISSSTTRSEPNCHSNSLLRSLPAAFISSLSLSTKSLFPLSRTRNTNPNPSAATPSVQSFVACVCTWRVSRLPNAVELRHYSQPFVQSHSHINCITTGSRTLLAHEQAPSHFITVTPCRVAVRLTTNLLGAVEIGRVVVSLIERCTYRGRRTRYQNQQQQQIHTIPSPSHLKQSHYKSYTRTRDILGKREIAGNAIGTLIVLDLCDISSATHLNQECFANHISIQHALVLECFCAKRNEPVVFEIPILVAFV